MRSQKLLWAPKKYVRDALTSVTSFCSDTRHEFKSSGDCWNEYLHMIRACTPSTILPSITNASLLDWSYFYVDCDGKNIRPRVVSCIFAHKALSIYLRQDITLSDVKIKSWRLTMSSIGPSNRPVLGFPSE
jgi:hypothetical protein